MSGAIDWGTSPWGEFVWGWESGRGILGYPGTINPTETLVLPILRPYRDPFVKVQPTDRSDGGDLYVYDKGMEEQIFETPLKLSKNDKDALKTFYDEKADGKANKVYYVDPYGGEHIVRIMNDEFDFVEESYGKHTGILTLRKED